jgi:hypothetical protein
VVSAAAFTSGEQQTAHGSVRAKLALVAWRRGGWGRRLHQGVDGGRGSCAGWPQQHREHGQGQYAVVPSPNPVQKGSAAGAFLAPSIQHGGSRARSGLGLIDGRAGLDEAPTRSPEVPTTNDTLSYPRATPSQIGAYARDGSLMGGRPMTSSRTPGSGLVPLEPTACRLRQGTSSSSGADKRTAPVNQHGRADLLACQRLCGRVVVVGRLQQRAWTAEDGSARSTVEVIADELGQASVGDGDHD